MDTQEPKELSKPSRRVVLSTGTVSMPPSYEQEVQCCPSPRVLLTNITSKQRTCQRTIFQLRQMPYR